MSFLDIVKENSDYIVNKYNSGIGCFSIAKEFNCNTYYIWTELKRRGINIRKRSEVYGNKDKYIDEVKRLYLDGISVYGIEKKLGISSSNILRWLSSEGIDTSRGCKNREDPLRNHRDDIIERYKKGESCLNIAKHYNGAENNIRKIIKESGIKLRKGKKIS
jgi:transposase